MKPTEKICFIYTTWPNKKAAMVAAKKLLAERLIACANISGPITSVYRWSAHDLERTHATGVKARVQRDKIEQAQEYVMILKTRSQLYPQVEKRINQLHPYECPCIVKLAITKATSVFNDWILAETVGLHTA